MLPMNTGHVVLDGLSAVELRHVLQAKFGIKLPCLMPRDLLAALILHTECNGHRHGYEANPFFQPYITCSACDWMLVKKVSRESFNRAVSHHKEGTYVHYVLTFWFRRYVTSDIPGCVK